MYTYLKCLLQRETFSGHMKTGLVCEGRGGILDNNNITIKQLFDAAQYGELFLVYIQRLM